MNNLPAVKEQALTQREFTPAQLTLLKNTLAMGTSDDEFKLFLAIADRKGLDPFKKQIYAIMYGGKMAVVSAIDGYRAIAERTKEHGGTVYAGQDLPIWGPDVNGHPEWADVTVYRIVQGIRVPFPARAWWKDYGKVQRTNPNWQESPHNQIAVRAEAIALRKGFPEGLSDVGLAEDYERVINHQTGEIIDIPLEHLAAAPQSAGHSERPAATPTRQEQAPSPFPDDSVMVVCPCGVRWGAEKSGFGGNMTCGHPTDKKGSDGKTIFHNRDRVLADKLKATIEASGLSPTEATDLIKDRFDGLTASKLSDIQRYQAIGLFAPMAEEAETPLPVEEGAPAE